MLTEATQKYFLFHLKSVRFVLPCERLGDLIDFWESPSDSGILNIYVKGTTLKPLFWSAQCSVSMEVRNIRYIEQCDRIPACSIGQVSIVTL